MKTCSIEKCSKRYHAKGYCYLHYNKNLKGQNLLDTPGKGRFSKYESIDQVFDDGFITGDSTECWIWNKGCNSGGYGIVSFKDIKIFAHRFSYKKFIGDIPEGMSVCHKCDVTRCINPNHLFIGSHGDNMRDMIAKGRQPKIRKRLKQKTY